LARLIEVFQAPIIKCEKVDKTYVTGDIRVDALKQVSLEIERGEMVAVMGRLAAARRHC
jgi:ABC-type phosphate/phosphonate transport system ATPase subunit